MDDNDNKTTTTPVVDNNVANNNVTNNNATVTNNNVTDNNVVKNGGNETKTDDNINYVKLRVERAKEQTTKEILKELGVDNLENAKQLIANGTTALDEVNKLKAKIEAQEKENEISVKKSLLSKVLENEKVFDADALINYVDLDKVEIENGEIKDSQNIISSLKKVKPNFFGVTQMTSDNYVKGQTSAPMTALDKQKAGNNVGAINDYLKNILK